MVFGVQLSKVKQLEASVDNESPAVQNYSKSTDSPPLGKGRKTVHLEATQAATAQKLEAVEEELTSFERSTLRWARTAVFMSGLAAIFVSAQWCEMHIGGVDTHALALAAGDQANRMQDFANRMKDQNDRTKDLADRMRDQFEQTKKIAGQAVIQADAAKSAADTAYEALHVTERAYIANPSPTLDFDNHILDVSFFNNGHIPSGPITGEIHTAIFAVINPTDTAMTPHPIEAIRWSKIDIAGLVQQTFGTTSVPLPKLDKQRYELGAQQFVVSGFITYTDGFKQSSPITLSICWKSMFQTELKKTAILPCDNSFFLAEMRKRDGYPNNESK